MRKISGYILTVSILLAIGNTGYALINPTFTPVDLVKNADLILLLKISPADDKGLCKAEIHRVIKGRPAGKTLIIDAGKSPNPEYAKEIKQRMSALGDDPALLFIGKGEKAEPVSRLHLGGKWVSLEKGAVEGVWNVDSIDVPMEETWAGGTDMLLKMSELIVKHPDTRVPCSVSGGWREAVNIGMVPGKVAEALAVVLAGDEDPGLYVASENGDQVFKFDRKSGKFEALTAKIKLGAKSRVAAWGDFNGDGRLDLASSDGQRLTLWLQAGDGTFVPSAVADVPKGGCLGLAAMDAGVNGRAGLLWSSASAPVLLVPDKEKPGAFVQKVLRPGAALKDPGSPGRCLVADFAGDGLADVIQPFGNGSLFFKGKGGGEFGEGVACPVALGRGRTGAWLGDYDADGHIDVFTVSGDGCRLWQNAGSGRFTESLALSGEVGYISQADGIGGNTCDIDNDGNQDLFICYANKGPQIFFNRGFRSFGHAHAPVDLGERNILPECLTGQQAGVVADFNVDGAQDMVLVALNGSVWYLQQAVDEPALAARVALAPGGNYSGPLTVTAANDCRSLGAWVVSPGAGEAFLARVDAGPVTIAWQMPGEARQTKAMTLEDKPKRFVIGDVRK